MHKNKEKQNVQEMNTPNNDREGTEDEKDDDIFPQDPIPIFIPEYFTIFIGIYSFRNPFCSKTIESLLLNASNVEILSIGIYEENDKNDVNELKYCINYKSKCNEYETRYQKHTGFKLLSSRDKQQKAITKQKLKKEKLRKKKQIM